MGEIPYDGVLKIGHNVQIGYFAQNQAQLLDGDITVFDTIDRIAKGDVRLKIRDILGAFMFGGEASDKYVRVLSGGERSRLAMLVLLLNPVNFLILDEPTNHLDLRSKDVLKNAIKSFDGTVIVVSHDRDFLDGLVDKVYEFGGGVVREHIGGIYDFLREKYGALENQDVKMSSEGSPSASTPATSVANTKPATAGGRSSYEADKERARAVKRIEKAVAEKETLVGNLESEIAEMEQKMSTASSGADSDLYGRYAELKKSLDEALEEWERLSMELEDAKK